MPHDSPLVPGAYLLDGGAGAISANVGRPTVSVHVANTGDRPIQVGSHYHFFEVNSFLIFDRAAAYGMRLNVPAGTAVRFEPGDTKEVALVALGGKRVVLGHRGWTSGPLDDPAIRSVALQWATAATPTAQTGHTPPEQGGGEEGV
jgi:urease beta subunit